jgi:hypothetical protein
MSPVRRVLSRSLISAPVPGACNKYRNAWLRFRGADRLLQLGGLTRSTAVYEPPDPRSDRSAGVVWQLRLGWIDRIVPGAAEARMVAWHGFLRVTFFLHNLLLQLR